MCTLNLLDLTSTLTHCPEWRVCFIQCAGLLVLTLAGCFKLLDGNKQNSFWFYNNNNNNNNNSNHNNNNNNNNNNKNNNKNNNNK